MLLLRRRKGQRLSIGDDVVLTVTKITNSHVQFAIACPETIRILRHEAKNREPKPSPGKPSSPVLIATAPALPEADQ